MTTIQADFRILFAQFLNDGARLAVDIMSPVWNNSHNLAYSLCCDGAGILERITMWSNDYIQGNVEKEAKFVEYFTEQITALRNDKRYTTNKKVQDYCNEYEAKIVNIQKCEQ